MAHVCRLKEVSPQRLVAMRVRCEPGSVGAAIAHCLEQVWERLNRLEDVTVGPAIVRYHGVTDDEVEFEAGFPVLQEVPATEDIRVDEMPGGPAATTLHWGPYEGLPEAHAALRTWMEEHGLAPAGLVYEVYWVDQNAAADRSELRTEVVWPVERQAEGASDDT